MTYGLKIYTEAGNLQLSETGRTYRVAFSGTGQVVSDEYSDVTIKISSTNEILENKLIAIRQVNPGIYTLLAGMDAGYAVSGEPYYPGTTIGWLADATQHDFVVVDCNNWSAPSGYGLAIYNEEGAQAFNSVDPLFVITSIIKIPVSTATPESSVTFDVTNVYGKPVYIVSCSRLGAAVYYGPTQAKSFLLYFKANAAGTSVTLTIDSGIINNVPNATSLPTTDVLTVVLGVMT